jgi:predicted site-specific integrase-resolvase
VTAAARRSVRCAIYTRVSTESGLDQDFNSLDAQFDAAQAYIRSQAHAGWTLVRTRYDDGGFSGGSIDRPALQQLLNDIRAHKINVIVVYKVDRLTRSLADFAKLVELFDAHGVSFVSVTQQFNTTTSMGRLTLNVLLSFAQFEREVSFGLVRNDRDFSVLGLVAQGDHPANPKALAFGGADLVADTLGGRPRVNVRAFPTAAIRAVAVSTPMPGIVVNRLAASSLRARCVSSSLRPFIRRSMLRHSSRMSSMSRRRRGARPLRSFDKISGRCRSSLHRPCGTVIPRSSMSARI